MPIDETLLQQMSADIEAQLSQKRLAHTTRRALQMDRLMLAFMKENLETQHKVNTMWQVFKPMAWIMSIAVTGIIGMVVAGRVEIIIR